MSRRITTRTIVPVAVIMAAFITVCFILLYTYIQDLMLEGEVKRVACMAKTVARSTGYDMLKNDHAALNYTVKNIGSNPGMVHLRIFDKKGVIRFSSNDHEVGHLVDRKAESCNVCHSPDGVSTVPDGGGRIERVRFFTDSQDQNIIGLTYPIPRQEGCVTASCHPGNQDKSLLGTVDVAMSQRSFEKGMDGVVNVLVGFWFMVVLLSIGLIAAILQKNVLVPINRLVAYVKQLRRGIYVDAELEDSYELEYIADTVKELAEKVKKHELG
ncbi:hypothetical protein [Desulfuromonas acetoxidans]|uniref:Histidine kinase, HAMP region n=1 Tax=Desulfuromonas acetoxidans (strain DSM 684 / 11070) TaxID=281689 RepID=Q1JWE0_DESA6|nr:hypothetical protein [Desulfuromonas acetoxidans]EAT14543.1 histidine kinase, HAMP region [Desulfuromonas acetoxidans DSM 684]MBF0645614.1 hypothetical protein [Desulfuromonas acetoxidans]NVD24335.1 hypothetical protein [Desulfuromonas acetoxidans]NVE14892.1 hypothetical protein [Desulfuromonas acetoxidans]